MRRGLALATARTIATLPGCSTDAFLQGMKGVGTTSNMITANRELWRWIACVKWLKFSKLT